MGPGYLGGEGGEGGLPEKNSRAATEASIFVNSRRMLLSLINTQPAFSEFLLQVAVAFFTISTTRNLFKVLCTIKNK